MSFLIADRVKETSTSTGTGAFTLAGAMIGFQTFSSAIGNGNQTFYTITDGIDWEVGSGTYFSSGSVLNRDAVISSSNSNNPVNWGAGEKQVFVTYPASQAVYNFPPNIVITGAVNATSTVGAVVAQSILVDYLVVAGGGGGGGFGGGGAGGYRSFSSQELSLATSYTVTVGAGGTGGSGTTKGTNGSNSVLSSNTSSGGGGGGAFSATLQNGNNGGSGGGGGASSTAPTYTKGTGGTGNTPSTSPSQGNNGGDGSDGAASAGGGGGAGAAGATSSGLLGGNGGDGLSSSITGSSIFRAGGGGGGGQNARGAGGNGGGGQGALSTGSPAASGTVNTGGGGGGGYATTGGTGGSGVVIIKYLDSYTISNPGGGLTFSTSTAVSGFKITTFTAGTGNVQWS